MTQNLAHVLEDTAARTPDAVALTFEDRSLTYRDLNVITGRTTALLRSAGVEPGDRVAIWLPNDPAFATALYGAWRLGAIVVPVHASFTEAEAKHVLKDSGAKVVFAGPAQFEIAEQLIGDIGTLTHVVPLKRSDDLDPAAAGPIDVRPIAEVGDDDLALIAYTAGTTGFSKGAMLTHANLRANLEQMKQTEIGVRPDDVVLCFLPLFHIFGLNVVLNLSFDVGARIVLFDRFDAQASLDAIKSEGVTVVAGAPPAYMQWLALPAPPPDVFAGVRVAISGAAPLPKEVLVGFEERFGATIWEGYGLTETSPAVTFTGVGGVAKPGSIGRPLPGVEVRLVDEDGEDVEDEGDSGEIVVRGPNVFKGYWQMPDETGKAFLDGWFRTGDVGVRDDDGDVFIVDRRKDMILVSGFNVYPREVEDVLRRHPHVGDVAVVGSLDPVHGEAVRAIVVPDPPGETVTAEEILDFCRRSLAPYKVPSVVDFVADIPRNAAGKVLRRALRS